MGCEAGFYISAQDSHRSYFEQQCRNHFDRPNRSLGKSISGNCWVNRVHRIRSVGSKTHFGHLCNPDNGLERRSRRRMGVSKPSRVGSCSRNSLSLSHKRHRKSDCCNPGIHRSCTSHTIPSSYSQSTLPLPCMSCTLPDSGIPGSFLMNTTGIALKCC